MNDKDGAIDIFSPLTIYNFSIPFFSCFFFVCFVFFCCVCAFDFFFSPYSIVDGFIDEE